MYSLGQALLPDHLFTPVVPDCTSAWGPRSAAALTVRVMPHSCLRRKRLLPAGLGAERGCGGKAGGSSGYRLLERMGMSICKRGWLPTGGGNWHSRPATGQGAAIDLSRKAHDHHSKVATRRRNRPREKGRQGNTRPNSTTRPGGQGREGSGLGRQAETRAELIGRTTDDLSTGANRPGALGELEVG